MGPSYVHALIVEYIRYRIDTEKAQSLVDAYVIASKSLQQSPHCHGYELTQCTEARESFNLRILWDSEEGHLKGFRTSEEFKSFFAAIKPFIPNIEEMRHYEHTAVQWTR